MRVLALQRDRMAGELLEKAMQKAMREYLEKQRKA
jgi:hypothetical protein